MATLIRSRIILFAGNLHSQIGTGREKCFDPIAQVYEIRLAAADLELAVR
jgi:hypothetical protein